MMGLYSSNADLLAALCILAPEENVRIAVVGVIEFIESHDEDIVFDRQAIFECIAQGVVNGFQSTPINWELTGSEEDFSGETAESVIEKFKQQLGTDGED